MKFRLIIECVDCGATVEVHAFEWDIRRILHTCPSEKISVVFEPPRAIF